MPELVVIAEQLLVPVPGGAGRYTAELLRALAETALEGGTVSSVVARHADTEPARIRGVAGPRVLGLPRRVLQAWWRAGMPLWPGGEAVHAPTPLAPPRSPQGRTLWVAVHDTVAWTHPGTLTPRGVSWHRAAIGGACRRADAVLVPTHAAADELARWVRVAALIHVIAHGPVPCPVCRSRPVDTPGLPRWYVLAVGTLEPRKGIDVLIEALSTLADITLVLAGRPGRGAVDPHALAAKHGLAPERIRVLDAPSDAELAAVLRAASVLAMPSLAEGLGLPVLEAMAAGVAVVDSDVPALVEVAGGAGISVLRGDALALATALAEVLDSAECARVCATAGLARARTFSWRRAAEAVWAVHTDGAH